MTIETTTNTVVEAITVPANGKNPTTFCPICKRPVARRAGTRVEASSRRVVYICRCGCEYYSTVGRK